MNVLQQKTNQNPVINESKLIQTPLGNIISREELLMKGLLQFFSHSYNLDHKRAVTANFWHRQFPVRTWHQQFPFPRPVHHNMPAQKPFPVRRLKVL